MTDLALSCSRCGHALRLMPREKIQRKDTCANCEADLHACVHCRFFDPGRDNQCSEPQAEWVKDKESANFCDYFEPRMSVNMSSGGGGNRTSDARAAFDNLFKK